MDSSIKKILVNRNGQPHTESVMRTDAEHRVYKINNAIEMERLDAIAADITSLYGGDIKFIILSSQHDGILGFTDLEATNLPCIKYTKQFIESKCRSVDAYHRKFKWVDPYTPEYHAYLKSISEYLTKMTKDSKDTIYCVGELKQSTTQCKNMMISDLHMSE